MSICIPTKNRIDALKVTISSITTDPFFRIQDDIEIVIANSGGTEGFDDLILVLSNEFPGRITYVESKDATYVENFCAVLSSSKGAFRKIINDTAVWRENTVSLVYDAAKILHETHGLLVTPNAVSLKALTVENFKTVSEFIEICSINSTWLGAYGFWAEDISFVIDQMRVHSETELPHLLAFMGLMSRGRGGSAVLENIFNVQVVDRKGTYSLSKVFVKNYLKCLRNFNITGELYEREKSRALVHTLSYHFNPRYDFYKQSVFEDLADVSDLPDFKEKFLEHRNSFIRYLNPSLDRGQLWRFLNPHNETIISGNANISRVYVGRATYGTLNAHWWGAENEFLFLGNYVSIAQNVVFLLGGNHPYQGFSTFPFKVKSFGAKEEAISKGPIIVEDDVWIGWGTIILSGVRIGKGAVIGAGSVISKDIPSYSIVVGNPAKVIEYRFEDSIREKLSKRNFHSLQFDNRGTLIERLYERLTPENVDSILEEIFGC